MAATVADHLVQRLREWQVRHAFGYPGDGINGIVTAFGRAQASGVPAVTPWAACPSLALRYQDRGRRWCLTAKDGESG
jgi:hypothetical protein